MKRPVGLPDDVRPDFQGFSEAAFSFLSDLARNNDRGWFSERRELYDSEVRFPMECLLAEFTPSARPRGFPLQGHPKHGLFRIHRDVRFSKSKEPYKTHAGAVLTRSGHKGEPGFLYVHVQPGECFLAAGFLSTRPEFLLAWRTRIAEDPEAFLAIVGPFLDPDGAHRLRHRGEPVRTMPRGFRGHAGSPAAEYLRWKNCMVVRPLADGETRSRGLLDAIEETAEAAGPLLRFGWEIRDSLLGDDPRPSMRGGR